MSLHERLKEKLRDWLKKTRDKVEKEIDRLIEIGVPELVAYVLGLLIPLPPPAKNIAVKYLTERVVARLAPGIGREQALEVWGEVEGDPELLARAVGLLREFVEILEEEGYGPETLRELVEALRQAKDFLARLSKLEERVGGLEKGVARLEREVEALGYAIYRLAKKLEAIETEVARLKVELIEKIRNILGEIAFIKKELRELKKKQKELEERQRAFKKKVENEFGILKDDQKILWDELIKLKIILKYGTEQLTDEELEYYIIGEKGKYRKIEKISERQYNTIYRLKGDLIAKVANIEVAELRLKHEAQILKYIAHKAPYAEGVVKIVDEGIYRGSYAIVEEHIEGTTLWEYVRNDGVLTPQEALKLAQQLLETLKLLHKLDIVHRDIKPSNIMLRNSDPGRPVLIDFGTARHVDETMDKVEAVNSGFFTHPELREKGGRKKYYDIYSYAATILWALTTRELPDLQEMSLLLLEAGRKARALTRVLRKCLYSPGEVRDAYGVKLPPYPHALYVVSEDTSKKVEIVDRAVIGRRGREIYVRTAGLEVPLTQEKVPRNRPPLITRLSKGGHLKIDAVNMTVEAMPNIKNKPAIWRGKWINITGPTEVKPGDRVALAYKEGHEPYIVLRLKAK